jgi:hypothetical protein
MDPKDVIPATNPTTVTTTKESKMLRAYRTFVLTSIVGLWLGFFGLAYMVYNVLDIVDVHTKVLGMLIFGPDGKYESPEAKPEIKDISDGQVFANN